ncbi:MAG: UvrD-helicase domain-containing protein, partial [Gammaproteobacteria bacterium]
MTAPPKITNIDSRVIVSCAGSGKTRKLIKRLLCLLRGGAKPGEILAITFTNKAAGEIRERLLAEMERLSKCEAKREPAIAECYKRVLLADDPEYVFTAHTFHSWFLTLLQNRPWTRGGAGA